MKRNYPFQRWNQNVVRKWKFTVRFLFRVETSLNVLRAWNKNTSQMRKCAMRNLFICPPVPDFFFSSPSPPKQNREQPHAERLHSCQSRSNKRFHPAKFENEYSNGQRRYFPNLFPIEFQSFHLTLLSANDAARNMTTRRLHLRDGRVNLYSRKTASKNDKENDNSERLERMKNKYNLQRSEARKNYEEKHQAAINR